jgi:A/G-specific adenine glycosylase
MIFTKDIAPPHSDQLLDWYDQHRREMPWRSAPGHRPDPYHIWLSEIMLQQTTVATVKPYFEKFIKRWPSLRQFAASDLEDVLKMWAGLGYYARARNLHKCAGHLMAGLDGKFPQTQKQLLQLPGIGPYTAAALMAIAFDKRAVVVDGNVERVMARVFVVDEPLPRAKALLKEHAESLTPYKRPGDYAQAIMDLGATVCRPRKPLCSSCPWQSSCLAENRSVQEHYPQRIKKPPKPHRFGTAFWVQRDDGKILLRKRGPKGLLGAMMEIPSSPWIDKTDKAFTENQPQAHAPLDTDWHRGNCPIVRHTFTHFHLEMEIWQARASISATLADAARAEHCSWVDVNDLDNQALPTLMCKIIDAALK